MAVFIALQSEMAFSKKYVKTEMEVDLECVRNRTVTMW